MSSTGGSTPSAALGLNQAALLAAIVDSSDDAIYSKSPEGIITSWNRSAERMYGYSADEAIGRHIRMLLPHHRKGDEQRILSTILAGETIDHYETERRRRDGSLLAVSVTASPVRDGDGRVVGASIVARDISERREAERELRRSHAALEQYSAVVAHDLREPLVTVRGFAELLARRSADDLDESSRQCLEQIVGGLERMNRMVDAMLEYARVQSSPMVSAPVDLDRLVGEVLDGLAAQVAAAGAEVTVQPELPIVRGDRELLGQLLQNLVVNALKFHADGVRPEVQLSVRREDGSWVLSVADRGIGLDPAAQQQVFSPFERTATSPLFDGVGLGLSVCRGIAERHGGSVWFEPRAGGGTVFHVRLPT